MAIRLRSLSFNRRFTTRRPITMASCQSERCRLSGCRCESGETVFNAVAEPNRSTSPISRLDLSGGHKNACHLFVRFSYPNHLFRVLETVGRTEVFLLTNVLKRDCGILIAVDRFTTGANAHKLRGLANAYVLACETGPASRAEEYRTRLFGELVRLDRLARTQRIVD